MHFWKYQGTGNDFIMLDWRNEQPWTQADAKKIAHWCDRRFGIGADGLIGLTLREGFDFEMIYFNSDGSQSFCGNGGRCAVAFARQLGIIQNHYHFLGIDGAHEAVFSKTNNNVELKMNDVNSIETNGDVSILYTGSPHYIQFVVELDGVDMMQEGRAIRYSERFNKDGINVNLVRALSPTLLSVRTYERGVESETLSCGTGVTAAVLAAHSRHFGANDGQNEVNVLVQGGELSIRYVAENNGQTFSDIWLIGPAEKVFSGLFGA